MQLFALLLMRSIPAHDFPRNSAALTQEYAQRKEKMLQLRKQKEEEVFQQKQVRAGKHIMSPVLHCCAMQAARNAMIDAQAGFPARTLLRQDSLFI